MYKNLMVSLVLVSAFFVCNNITFAEDVMSQEKLPVKEAGINPDFKPPHHGFNKKGPHRGPSKEEMQAKKMEFEKRLKLTDEQKKMIEVNRAKDRELMKPVFEEMKAKRHAMKMVDFDATLSLEQKQAKKEELQTQMKELKEKADSVREANMKNFESLLTEKQKKEFAKIQEEQEKEMQKRRAEFEKIRKDRGEYHIPPQPTTIPLEK